MLIVLLDEPGLFAFRSAAEAGREIEPPTPRTKFARRSASLVSRIASNGCAAIDTARGYSVSSHQLCSSGCVRWTMSAGEKGLPSEVRGATG
jgi:hypothetical protein